MSAGHYRGSVKPTGYDHEAADPSIDVLTSGGRSGPLFASWRSARPALSVVIALVVGGVAGYLTGSGRSSPALAPTPESSFDASGTSVVVGTGARCSSQQGTTLQIGLEVANRSTKPVTLDQITVALPLGGLHTVSSSWSACGQLDPRDGREPLHLGPVATAWLSMTFDVLEQCPAPLPVLFTVEYSFQGQVKQDDVGGFRDLGEVPYDRCPPHS